MICNRNNFINELHCKNQSAIELTVDLYLPVVKSVVNKVLYRFGNNDVIEECINDIFLSIWNNSHKFTGTDEVDFKKWIYKIAKFKSIDYYRKIIRNMEVSTEDLDYLDEANSISAEEELVAAENRTELINLINTLEPIDKNIFIMKFFWGTKSDEIAEKLGITRSAVDNRIYRGKLKLIHKLEAI